MITETCSCGASIVVQQRFTTDEANIAAAWRKDHQHSEQIGGVLLSKPSRPLPRPSRIERIL